VPCQRSVNVRRFVTLACLAASMFREVLMAFCYLWGMSRKFRQGSSQGWVRGCYPRRMDREMLRQHLQQTEKHLAASEKLITDQRALIARLEERGYDTAKARTGPGSPRRNAEAAHSR
jgi:hypothetical protein